jgi:hypothetical protein
MLLSAKYYVMRDTDFRSSDTRENNYRSLTMNHKPQNNTCMTV